MLPQNFGTLFLWPSDYCFANVYVLAISASYAIDDVGGGAREVISDLN